MDERSDMPLEGRQIGMTLIAGICAMAGFTLSGFAGSLLGLTELVWMGKGMLAFIYLVVLFLPGLIMSLVVLHSRLSVLSAHRQLPLSLAWGVISYPAVDQVANVIPELVRATGHFEALPTLALICLEAVVAAGVLLAIAALLFAFFRPRSETQL
jgi:hypothetical protein